MNIVELVDFLRRSPGAVEDNPAFGRFLSSFEVADPDDPRSMVRLKSAHKAAIQELIDHGVLKGGAA